MSKSIMFQIWCVSKFFTISFLCIPQKFEMIVAKIMNSVYFNYSKERKVITYCVDDILFLKYEIWNFDFDSPGHFHLRQINYVHKWKIKILVFIMCKFVSFPYGSIEWHTEQQNKHSFWSFPNDFSNISIEMFIYCLVAKWMLNNVQYSKKFDKICVGCCWWCHHQ